MPALTRQAMAEHIERSVLTCRDDARLAHERGDIDLEAWATLHGNNLKAAAAELRKNCLGCRYFDAEVWVNALEHTVCGKWHPRPDDGSGFCHRWEPRVTGEPT